MSRSIRDGSGTTSLYSLSLGIVCSALFGPTSFASSLATEQAILIPSDVASNTSFGTSVAVDNDTAVVGARWVDYPNATDAGAVYVYVRNGTTWTEQAKITPADHGANHLFGSSVSLVGDTLIVGAPQWSAPGLAPAVGAVYVFERTGTTWSQQAILVPSDPGEKQYFGIAASMDGDTAVIGAWGDDHVGAIDGGSTYVFTRNGTNWSEQAKLVASDASAGDFFGGHVDISGDTAIVGVPWHNHAGTVNHGGTAYLFVRNGTAWSQQAKLIASDLSIVAEFGVSVAVRGDTAIVGAHTDSTQGLNSAGAAYVFERTGATWNEQAKLVASNGAAHDHFGMSVSIEHDIAAIGAYGVDVGGMANVGSTYLFERNGSSWSETAALIPSSAMPSSEFGRSVAMLDEELIVGAPFGPAGSRAHVYQVEDCAGTFLSYGTACPGSIGAPTLDISGCGSPGTSIQMDVANGAPNAMGLILIGGGAGSVAFNANCSLQVLPLLPFSLPISVPSSGDVSFSVMLPPVLPTPFDAYLQTLIADPSAALGIAATKPVQLHFD